MHNDACALNRGDSSDSEHIQDTARHAELRATHMRPSTPTSMETCRLRASGWHP